MAVLAGSYINLTKEAKPMFDYVGWRNEVNSFARRHNALTACFLSELTPEQRSEVIERAVKAYKAGTVLNLADLAVAALSTS